MKWRSFFVFSHSVSTDIDHFRVDFFDKISVSKYQVATGLEVEKTVRHDFWIFDISFTYIKRIKIMITIIIISILIKWRLRMSKFIIDFFNDEIDLNFRRLQFLRIFFSDLCSLDSFFSKRTFTKNNLYNRTLSYDWNLTWFLLLILRFLICYPGDNTEEERLFEWIERARLMKSVKMLHHEHVSFPINLYDGVFFENTISHVWGLKVFRIEHEERHSSTEEIFKWKLKMIHRRKNVVNGTKLKYWISLRQRNDFKF